MIAEIFKEFTENTELKVAIVRDIEKAVGRDLDPAKDHVFIDYVERHHHKTGEKFVYGAVVFEGEIWGFLDIDFGEPVVRFTPSPRLREI